MNKAELRELAVNSVDGLISDLESAAKRGAAVFGADELVKTLIPSFLGYNPELKIVPVYAGERRNLTDLLGCKDWVSTFFAISDAIKHKPSLIKPGDYFLLPIKANAGRFDGLEFSALDISETELVVVQVYRGKIVLNFEEVLFCSAVNAKNTNNGGFKESALAKYLNCQFLSALDPVKEILIENKDGQRVTLPTFYEVFGGNDYGDDVNWDNDPRQLEYFKKIKNRIRTKDNDTWWSWLSTPASSSSFAYVSGYGYATGSTASSTDGGVAPAICII